MRKSVKLPSDSCLFLTDEIERRYFSGIEVKEGYLFLGKENGYFTDARYNFAVIEKLKESDITSYIYNDFSDIERFIKENGIKTLFIDYDKTNLTLYKRLKKLGVRIKDYKDKIERIVSIKDSEQINSITKACGAIEDAITYAFENIYEGITEREVREMIISRCKLLGAEGESFDTIVAFGENSAIPHHETGDRKLCFGDVILIDTGCKVKGYCSDITRTAVYKKASEDFIENYNLVLKANLEVEEKIKKGMTTSDVDNIAREVFRKANKEKYFTHSTGHGIGLEIHEYPYLSSKRKGEMLKNNMVFTVEPGLYFNGKYGIRIEDTVIMKNGKVQRLYCDSKELLIL